MHAGDIKIQRIESGDNAGNYDIVFSNGQPDTTSGFDTCVFLAVYGDKNTWQNAIARNESEKIISDFPQIIAQGTVSEKTKNDGVQALQKALKFLKDIKAVKEISVTGRITNVYMIEWEVEMIRNNNESEQYSLRMNKSNKWDTNWISYEGV